MTDEQIGMILSLCGMIITVLSFQVKEKKGLLLFQTVGTGFYLISYIFSGGGIAVILNIIYVFRNFLFMYFNEKRGKRLYITCGILCFLYILSYIFFAVFVAEDLGERLWNLCPIIGAVFGTIAVVNSNVNRLRLWKYGDSCSWLLFNVRIGLGALGGIIGEVLNIISLTLGIIRYKKTENHQIQENENEQV